MFRSNYQTNVRDGKIVLTLLFIVYGAVWCRSQEQHPLENNLLPLRKTFEPYYDNCFFKSNEKADTYKVPAPCL